MKHAHRAKLPPPPCRLPFRRGAARSLGASITADERGPEPAGPFVYTLHMLCMAGAAAAVAVAAAAARCGANKAYNHSEWWAGVGRGWTGGLVGNRAKCWSWSGVRVE